MGDTIQRFDIFKFFNLYDEKRVGNFSTPGPVKVIIIPE
tara:strand:+ start:275 stop:391 length:117 start_codon:yes stop_codon:yes gene_type:complete